MSSDAQWHYSVLRSFNEQHYSHLLTSSHMVEGRTIINIGTKDIPDKRVVYIFKKNLKEYALEQQHIAELPIVVDDSIEVHYGRKAYDLITSFRSARFREERLLSFRQMVDDLVCFEHSDALDFILWKIIVLSSSITRLTCRVCSSPNFGKDSAVKVVGDLLGDSVIISNPTVAKLEYSLVNKVLVLNELANLSGAEKQAMEHFLLTTGDLSNTYEKRSRSTASTSETYNISNLSLLMVYNNIECYPEVKYFDDVFQEATKSRFIPFKLNGRLTQQIRSPLNVRDIAEKNSNYFKAFIRSMMWYRRHWQEEVAGKGVKTINSKTYELKNRWATNFDTIGFFICLYANDNKEAMTLTNELFKRHKAYLEMVGRTKYADSGGNLAVFEEKVNFT